MSPHFCTCVKKYSGNVKLPILST